MNKAGQWVYFFHSTSAANAPVDTLCEDLAKLVNDPLFSDVCFEVEGMKVHAHKAILVVRSDSFKAMFTSSMEEASKVGCQIAC